MTTPDFSPWAGAFARQLQRARRAGTLHQLELLFGPWIAHWLLVQQEEGDHSRNRRWNLRLSKLFRNVPIITHERMSPLLLVVLSLFAPAGERDAGRPERSGGRPEARSPAGRPRATAVPRP